MGKLRLLQDDYGAATSHFAALLETYEALAIGDPSNVIWQRGMAEAYKSLGKVSKAEGQLPEALDRYLMALRIDLDLLRKQPEGLHDQMVVANDYRHIGNLHQELGHKSEAMTAYENGLSIIETLREQWPKRRDFFVLFINFKVSMAKLEETTEQ